MLTENKFSKYLLYAVGEIILVVIGILIALQINNSNEKSKDIELAIKQVETLSQNLFRVNKNNAEIYFLQIHDSVLQALRNHRTELNPNFSRWYDKNPLELGYDLAYTMNENFDLVIDLEKSFPDEYTKVVQSIKETKIIHENLKPDIERLQIIERLNKEILLNNFDWFDDNTEVALKKRQEYFLNDSLFQNRLFDYIQSFKMYSSQANRLRMMKAKIWSEVELLKLNKTISHLKSGINEMGLVKLSEIDCSETYQESVLPSFLIWNLVHNSTNDTIPIGTWNSNKPTFYLPPNSFEVLSGRLNDAIRIFKNGNCSKKYRTMINGYLIIE